jgi:hypothetical protein
MPVKDFNFEANNAGLTCQRGARSHQMGALASFFTV